MAALLQNLRGEAQLVVRVECYPYDAAFKFARDIASDGEIIKIVNDKRPQVRPQDMKTPGVREAFTEWAMPQMVQLRTYLIRASRQLSNFSESRGNGCRQR